MGNRWGEGGRRAARGTALGAVKRHAWGTLFLRGGAQSGTGYRWGQQSGSGDSWGRQNDMGDRWG